MAAMASSPCSSIRYRIHFDGAAQPNPGKGGCGAICEESTDGGNTFEIMWEDNWHLGESCTCNMAEYLGMINALRKLFTYLQLSEDVSQEENISVEVIGDCELVINEMSGANRVQSYELESVFHIAKGLVTKFETYLRADVTFRHVLAEYNARADGLAKVGVERCTSTNGATNIELYRPSLMDLSSVIIPSMDIVEPFYASNDLMAEGCTDKCLMDSDFFKEHFGGVKAFQELSTDVPEVTWFLGKISVAVLGVYPGPLALSVSTGGSTVDIVVSNVYIIHKFSVPLHLHLTEGIIGGRNAAQLERENFPPPYCDHPWFRSNVHLMPY
jgi:ribonuclease HI